MRTPRGWRWFMMTCIFWLSACTSSVAQPAAQPTNLPTLTTLIVWHAFGGVTGNAIDELLQHIATTNNVNLVVQRMPIATIANDIQVAWPQSRGPHVVLLSNSQLHQIAPHQIALPLDTLIDVSSRNVIDAAVIATGQIRNRQGQLELLGLPITYELPVLYYNRRNVLTPPLYTDDLFSMARSLTAPPQWGLGADLSFDNFAGYLSAFGGQIIDAQDNIVLGTSGRSGTEAWLTWLTALNSDPLLLTRLNAIFSVKRSAGAGQMTMVIDDSSQQRTYQQLWGNDMGISALPMLSSANQPAQPYLRTTTVVLNQRLSPAEVEAARILLNTLIQNDAQQRLLNSGIQPVNRLVDITQHTAATNIRDAAIQANAPPSTLLRYDVHAVLRSMITQVVVGAQSPSDAVTTADQQLRQLIEGSSTP
ncbi:MAG: extracellular solute-binding protein [Chloroflexi bacterium]|nr:extracellular solute-binding protein [Chloroflexota bacterium]